MAVQIVMDPTGDTRHEFTAGDATAVAKAERRFKQLTGTGFTAAVRSAEGHSKRIRDFDPAAERRNWDCPRMPHITVEAAGKTFRAPSPLSKIPQALRAAFAPVMVAPKGQP